MSHRGWDFTGLVSFLGQPHPLPPAAGPDTPWIRAVGGFPGPFPWDWGLCPPGPPPLQGGPPRLKARFPLGLGHRQEMRIKNLSELAELFPACLNSLRLFQIALEKSTRQRWAASLYVSRVPSEGCEQP